jgi:hypothetical protein
MVDGPVTDRTPLVDEVVVAALCAVASLPPNALTRDSSSHRVTIGRAAATDLVRALDVYLPGVVDRMRASTRIGKLSRPASPTPLPSLDEAPDGG